MPLVSPSFLVINGVYFKYEDYISVFFLQTNYAKIKINILY